MPWRLTVTATPAAPVAAGPESDPTMPKPLDPETREAIRADVEAGELSRAAIGRKHGVSGWTVGNIAKQAGIDDPFSREKTKNATRARVADNASRRAELATAMLDDVEFLRSMYRQEWTKTVVVPGVGERRVEADTAEIAAGLQRLVTAVGITMDKHLTYDKYDSDDSGATAVDTWLRAMLGGQTPPVEG